MTGIIALFDPHASVAMGSGSGASGTSPASLLRCRVPVSIAKHLTPSGSVALILCWTNLVRIGVFAYLFAARTCCGGDVWLRSNRLPVEERWKNDASRLENQDEDDRKEKEPVSAEEHRAENVRKKEERRVDLSTGNVRLEERLWKDI